MRSAPHAFSGDIYENVGEGLVRVTKKDGRSGLFRTDGSWIEGEVTQAEPSMCLFIGVKDVAPGHDVSYQRTPSVVLDGKTPFDNTYSDLSKAPIFVKPYEGDMGKETPDGMRSAGWIDQEFFLQNDRYPERIPAVYHLKSPMPGGPQRVSKERYYSKKFHDLEVEHIWKKKWQMACREDDIPNVGDYHLYEIAHLSYIIVRTGENEFKAHENVCLHRGRKLIDCSGSGAQIFRCPYHGWSWKTDGSLNEIPCEWDFPGVRDTVNPLPHAQVATWGGFIFINPDPGAGPLEDYLGPVMMAHYEKFKLQNRYKQAHVQKVIRTNWKLVMEAFMESYHTPATHTQFLLYGGDLAQQRYDVWGNWGRANHIPTPGMASLRGVVISEDEALKKWHANADNNRAYLRSVIGDEVEAFSDAEVNDVGSFCDLFPNMCPWGGFSKITFRFRPNGDNPEEAIMDAMLLAPWPEGKPKPAPAAVRILGPDDPWSEAPELANLGKIFEQDVGNLPKVLAGLKATSQPYVWLSAYQEGKIRNLARNYNEALGLKDEF